MEQSFNPLPMLEKALWEVRRAYWEKQAMRNPKMSGWCGYEAWARLRREVSLISMYGHSAATRAETFSVWDCQLALDSGQPVDDIVIQANGAPVRRLNTRTMEVVEMLGSAGVNSSDIKALKSMFRNGSRLVVETPYFQMLSLNGRPVEEDTAPVQIKTRSWDIREFIEKGLVIQDEPNVFALTLAGKNAIEQFNAFPD